MRFVAAEASEGSVKMDAASSSLPAIVSPDAVPGHAAHMFSLWTGWPGLQPLMLENLSKLRPKLCCVPYLPAPGSSSRTVSSKYADARAQQPMSGKQSRPREVNCMTYIVISTPMLYYTGYSQKAETP